MSSTHHGSGVPKDLSELEDNPVCHGLEPFGKVDIHQILPLNLSPHLKHTCELCHIFRCKTGTVYGSVCVEFRMPLFYQRFSAAAVRSSRWIIKVILRFPQRLLTLYNCRKRSVAKFLKHHHCTRVHHMSGECDFKLSWSPYSEFLPVTGAILFAKCSKS